MQFSRHVHITGGALRSWFVAQCYNSICVGLLWWGGLTYLHVAVGAVLGGTGGMFQFIPHFGPVLAFVGPALAAILGRRTGYVSVGAGTLWSDCSGGWVFIAAAHHATNREDSNLGFADGADCAQPDAGILGTVASGAAAGGDLRVPGHREEARPGRRGPGCSAPDSAWAGDYWRSIALAGRAGKTRGTDERAVNCLVGDRCAGMWISDFHIPHDYNKARPAKATKHNV